MGGFGSAVLEALEGMDYDTTEIYAAGICRQLYTAREYFLPAKAREGGRYSPSPRR